MALHVIDMGPPGPLIQVGARVGGEFDASGRGGAPRSYSALIDTGASTTAISRKVIAEVQPQQVGSVKFGRAGSADAVGYLYDIRLKFDSHLLPGRWFDLEAIETDPATPGVDILIGQDLLLKLTMVYNGPLAKLVLMY